MGSAYEILGSDQFSNAVTLVGIVIALVAALIGYKEYTAQRAANADKHMHETFQAYLHRNLEFQEFLATQGRHADPAVVAEMQNSMNDLTLYTMEELYAWVRYQQRLLARRPFPVIGRLRGVLQSNIRCWSRTIIEHIEDRHDILMKSLRDDRECYGDEFAAFLEEHRWPALPANDHSAQNTSASAISR